MAQLFRLTGAEGEVCAVVVDKVYAFGVANLYSLVELYLFFSSIVRQKMTMDCYFVLKSYKNMNAIKFLFENFLRDKRVYALNQHYWAHQLGKAIPKDKVESKNWYNNEFANEVKIYDKPILVLDPYCKLILGRDMPGV